MFVQNRNKTMSIYNISAIVNKLPSGNHYTYTRVRNLLLGLKGNSSKKEIQHLRRILKNSWMEIDTVLEKLENE